MRVTAQELVLASAKNTMEETVFGVGEGGEGGVGGGNAAASAVVGMVAPRRPLALCRLGDSG
jgi:carbohydrate-binding DOMON domain-containing protein